MELIRRIGRHEKDYWIFYDESRDFLPNVIIKERAGMTCGRGKKATCISLEFQERRRRERKEKKVHLESTLPLIKILFK